MIRAIYKTPEELEYTLKKMEKVAIFACTACAYVNNVGGPEGVDFVKELLKKMGKDVVLAAPILSACWEAAMATAQQELLNPIVSDIDALVVISCLGGVQSANLCKPGVRVIAACDSFGAATQLPRGDTRTDLVLNPQKHIPIDGHNVHSFTAGIDPEGECPLKTKYGPCNDHPKDDVIQCTENSNHDCVWRIIDREVEKRGGNLADLKGLEKLHKTENYTRVPCFHKKTPVGLKQSVGKYGMKLTKMLTPFIRFTD